MRGPERGRNGQPLPREHVPRRFFRWFRPDHFRSADPSPGAAVHREGNASFLPVARQSLETAAGAGLRYRRRAQLQETDDGPVRCPGEQRGHRRSPDAASVRRDVGRIRFAARQGDRPGHERSECVGRDRRRSGRSAQSWPRFNRLARDAAAVCAATRPCSPRRDCQRPALGAIRGAPLNPGRWRRSSAHRDHGWGSCNGVSRSRGACLTVACLRRT